MFDNFVKLKSLNRELKLRRSVYPRQVARGNMTQAEAEREIQIFEDIAHDYREKVSNGDLFPADSPRPGHNPAG
jgi:hypothetical protein